MDTFQAVCSLGAPHLDVQVHLKAGSFDHASARVQARSGHACHTDQDNCYLSIDARVGASVLSDESISICTCFGSSMESLW